MHGIIDEKTDVFAYGVLLLELITGRRAVDSSQQSLVIWVRKKMRIAKVVIYNLRNYCRSFINHIIVDYLSNFEIKI